MENIIQLNDIEYNEICDKVCKTFKFNPSVHKKDWPSFKEPSPFITYDISEKYEDDIIDEWREISLKVLKECTDKEEFIYALDWYHQSYFYNLHLRKTLEKVPVIPFPDGDYYIFLPKDFRWGILTHPWEKTICIFGKDLIDRFSEHNPKMLQTIKRQG